MSTAAVTPVLGRWKQFAGALVSPHGRWTLAIFTAMLVGADLVAVGPGWVALATVIALAILNTPWITAGTHERGLAGLIGALIALYLILLLEIYLGSTGLRFGPIGAIGRGRLASVDAEIIWVLDLIYRHGGSLKSLVGGFVFLIVYYGVHRFTAKFANSLNNIWAGIGGFVAVVLMFPFAQGFEGKQVAFTRATLDVSSSLKTLGAFETARQEAIKEDAALRALVAELHDEKREPEREAVVRAIRAYAKLLLQLDDDGRARTRILYKPEDAYEAANFLAPPEVTYPPRPEREVAPVEAGADDDVGATSVAHAEELGNKRNALLDEVTRLRHERDAALTAIRIFVADEVNEELAQRRRSEVADDARSAIVYIMVLRNMADATRELEAKIAELQARIAREEQTNQRLTDHVARHRQFRLASLRRDAQCAAIRRAVFTWLTGPGADLTRRLTERWESAGTALRRDRPPAHVLDPPPGLDREGLDRSVTDELRRDGAWPPAYTENDLAGDLIRVNETAGGTLSSFIDASCRAQRRSR